MNWQSFHNPQGNKHQPPIVLSSDRLKVELALPGQVYSGSRFDWTGFITQVTLDKRHTYCTLESFTEGSGTGGIGMCNEFGITRPIGYEEAAVGERFPKPGIGLLTRLDDSPYQFARPYPVEPYAMAVTANRDTAEIRIEALPCNGYALQLVKKIAITDNCLRISYTLTNSGDKAFSTNEYVHNFVAMDGHPIGPEYRLRLPDGFVLHSDGSELTNPMLFEDGVMHWRYAPQTAFYCRYEGAYPAGLQWELRHESGTGMRESVDFAPATVALWGEGHVVSPEIFCEFTLQPGETLTWSRLFEFFGA